MMGFPLTITLAETDAIGTGRHVLVVHGFEPGDGGTGHVVGFPAMSPAHSAGAPPTSTFVCFGNSTTGPL